MQLSPTIELALEQVAWRYGADHAGLRNALLHESAAELGQALGIDAGAADDRLRRVLRAVTIESDLGAGCKLLTDDVQAEVLAAIAAW